MINGSDKNKLEGTARMNDTLIEHSDCHGQNHFIQLKDSFHIDYLSSSKPKLICNVNNNNLNQYQSIPNAHSFQNDIEENNKHDDQTRKIVQKKPFSFEEDELLLSLVNSFQDKKDWILISFFMKENNHNRSARQCRDRYLHYLDPKLINNFVWSPEEDNLLMKAVEIQGKKWKILEKSFPGRSEVSLRNRYHLLLRKMSKSNPNTEKKTNIMSNKFSFLDNYYKKNKKQQKSQKIPEKTNLFFEEINTIKGANSNSLDDFDLFTFDDEELNNFFVY